MAQTPIVIGTANAKDGDNLFDAFTKVNDNSVDITNTTDALNTRLDAIEGVTPASVPGGMFVSDGAGGGEFIRIQGWSQYDDSKTDVGTPSQVIATGVRTQLTNDGGTTTLNKLPSDATIPLWNTVTNAVNPIALFDTYNLRVKFTVENYGGTSPSIEVELDIGGGLGTIVDSSRALLKSGAKQTILMSFPVFAGSAFLTNGGKIYVTYTGTGSCDIYGTGVLVIRESKNYV